MVSGDTFVFVLALLGIGILTLGSVGAAINGDQDSKSVKEREIRTGVALNLITGAAASVALFGLWILYGTLNTAKTAAAAAQQQAQAALMAAHTAQKALELSERAWMAPRKAALVMPLSPVTEMKLAITFENTGRGPANNVRTAGFGNNTQIFHPDTRQNAVILPKNNTCDWISSAEPGIATIFPGGPYDMYLPFAGGNPPPGLLDQIVNDERGLYVEGCIAYDTLETTHHTAFCYYLLPPKRGTGKIEESMKWPWVFCPTGNFAD